MNEHPMLFSAPMVRALIDGPKTQTRRVLKPQPQDDGKYHDVKPAYRALRIAAGDRIWVRETWRADVFYDDLKPIDIDPRAAVRYEATAEWGRGNGVAGKTRVCMHMPRAFSRITLDVVGVKVERLQDISNEDCIAEGVPIHPNQNAPRTGRAIDAFAREHGLISHYGAQYRAIWEAINGAGSWEANPWVVAYTFSVHHQNIDMLEQKESA